MATTHLGKWILTFLFIIYATASGSPFRESKYLQKRPANNVNYRLPTNVIPEKYQIKLIPKIRKDFDFDGEITIQVHILQTTDVITLHANDLEVSKVRLKNIRSNSTYYPVHQSNDTETDFYTIKFKDQLQKNEKYEIYIKYKGYHRRDRKGFFRTWYKNEKKEIISYVATQFEPLYARRAFPCFDEPGLKAKFQINIAREKHLRSVSNMPLEKTQYSPELNLYWDIFEETPMPMSTYLVAFAVSDFEFTRNGIVSIFHKKGLGPQAIYPATFSTKALRYLENYTDIPYFLPKMDEIAIENEFGPGAMENWGLCAFREQLLLFADNISTSEDRQNIAIIIFHELGHQWFGNLVTPKWWKYLWISEGFAAYFQYLGTVALEPKWRLDEQFVVESLHSAFSVDEQLYRTHPMTLEINDPKDVETKFDSITYLKASSVIRMIEHILSPQTFRKALTRYLSRMGNSTAEDLDLFEDLDIQYHEEHPNTDVDIKAVMKSWAWQSGFPIITVNRNYKKGTIKISQSRFLLNGSVNDNSTWWIPLTYATKSNPNFKESKVKHWLKGNEREKSFDLQLDINDWVIFNIQETGFYRVNYDSDNWCQIIKYLKTKDFTKIHPVNRAQLLNDAFTFGRSGVLPYETVLNLTSYLSEETDYIVWSAAYDGFSFLLNKLKGMKNYTLFKNYVLKLLDKVYNVLGFDERSEESHIDKLNRNKILTLACKFGHKGCLETVLHKFDMLMQNPVDNRVNPDIQSVVYCYGAMARGKEGQDFLGKIYLNTTVYTEIFLIMHAWSCARGEHSILREFMIENGKEIKKEVILETLVDSNINGPYPDYFIDFIIKNYHETSDLWISSVVEIITTDTQYYKLKSFLDKTIKNETHVMRLLQPTVEKLEWQEKYGPAIFNWLYKIEPQKIYS